MFYNLDLFTFNEDDAKSLYDRFQIISKAKLMKEKIALKKQLKEAKELIELLDGYLKYTGACGYDCHVGEDQCIIKERMRALGL